MDFKQNKLSKTSLALFCLVILTALVSCSDDNFLAPTNTGGIEESKIFSDSTYTIHFLNNIYTSIGFSNDPGRFGNGGLDAASDESEPDESNTLAATTQFATGTINPNVVTDDAWRIPYENIRKVNIFLKHLPDVPIKNEATKTVLGAEARFLRAWYYSILLKHYGGVPIVGDTVYTDKEKIPAVRNTYKETVDYIVAECDTISQILPVRRTGSQYGRAGGGAAMALKARVLLSAASPLHNGSGFGDSEPYISLTGYPDHDQERWKRAADAAKAVMNTGEYDLYVDNSDAPGQGFQELFTIRSDNEYILQYMNGGPRYLESLWQPPSRNGNNGAFPYQETVDAFTMKDGTPIDDPSSGYDPAHPYQNRDPRLDYSIIHDQTPLVQIGEPEDIPVDIYLGTYQGEQASQDAVHSGTPTGYYTNKMLDPDVSANDVGGTQRCRPLIRYAEILLDYAETTNEYSGPTQEVYDAIEKIRARAGIDSTSNDMYGLEPNMTKDEMRQVIHHERRVELAFEGFRFWDVRRWMTAEETQDRTLTGMEIVRDGSQTQHNIFDVRKHVFFKAMYFWPIPESEVAKSPELTQNPYW